MQKINIHLRENLKIMGIEDKILQLITKAEIYKTDTNIVILNEAEGVGCFSNPNIKICCELFAYENKDISVQETMLRELFVLISEEAKLDLSNVSGIIHQLDKDHYISNSEKVTIERLFREESFKILGL